MRLEKHGRRNWAVYDAAGELVVIAVYKKGAVEVLRRLGAPPDTLRELARRHAPPPVPKAQYIIRRQRA